MMMKTTMAPLTAVVSIAFLVAALAPTPVVARERSPGLLGGGGGRAASAAAIAAAAAAAQPQTQAGCKCESKWSFGGLELTGCANPNQDPNGYWCAVSDDCAGSYGSYPVAHPSGNPRLTTLMPYDYCTGKDAEGKFWPGPRERTASGCLCQAGRWTMALPGEDSAVAGALGSAVPAGKSGYHDRCAAPGDGVTRQCVVDVRTCPGSPPPSGEMVDSCALLDAASAEKRGDADTAAAAASQDAALRYFASVPPETHKTLTGCSCQRNGWRYTYADGSVSELYKGCANPDGDPLGPWCAVDATACAWFAGEIRRGTTDSSLEHPGSAQAYDYCRVPVDAAAKDPEAAKLSWKAGALAETARESIAQAAALLSDQRDFVKANILAPEKKAAAEGVAPPTRPKTTEGWGLPVSACRLGQLAGWAQCGGKAACGEWGCLDAAWSGRCCEPGFVCERQQSYFWQCVPPEVAVSYGGAEDACDPQALARRKAAEEAALREGTAPPAAPFPMPTVLGAGAQCGGLADCPADIKGTDACGDRPWPNLCCPGKGSRCVRQRGNPWFWQCEGGDAAEEQQQAPAATADVPAPFPEAVAAAAAPAALAVGPFESSQIVFNPEQGRADAPASAGLSPGRSFVMTVKVDGDYDKLVGSPEEMAAAAAASTGANSGGAFFETAALREFKAGLVEMVARAAAAPANTLYSIEVTNVAPGSIVADVAVTFAAQAPEADVSAAFSRLRDGAAASYAVASMPSSFGSLMSVSLSADSGVLTTAGGLNNGALVKGRRRAGPGVDADAAFGQRKTVGVLGSGALAGICIGMMAGLAAAAFAVHKGASARAALGKDADKDRQLRYQASTEGEVARELAGEGRLAPEEVVGGAELLKGAAEERRRASEGGRAADAAEAGGAAEGPAVPGGGPWVHGWLSALERAGGGALRQAGAGVGKAGAGIIKGIVRPRSAAAAQNNGGGGGGASSSSPAPAMAAGSPAFLERGASGGGGAADVAAYATAVEAPGKATTTSRRGSKA